jgi:gliding motility-associated-like protein
MNEWGCRDSSSVTILVNDDMDEGIPTAFTPNGDGNNDVFRIPHLRYQKLVEFNIYNRWGQIIFHNASDLKKGWDGTFNGEKQDMGVYSYMIIVARPDGTQKIYKGDVTLLR